MVFFIKSYIYSPLFSFFTLICYLYEKGIYILSLLLILNSFYTLVKIKSQYNKKLIFTEITSLRYAQLY